MIVYRLLHKEKKLGLKSPTPIWCKQQKHLLMSIKKLTKTTKYQLEHIKKSFCDCS